MRDVESAARVSSQPAHRSIPHALCVDHVFVRHWAVNHCHPPARARVVDTWDGPVVIKQSVPRQMFDVASCENEIHGDTS